MSSSRHSKRDRGDRSDRDRNSYESRSRSKDTTPEINSIFKGEITTVKPFGAFVKIPGCYKNGLVHRSQLSKSNVEDPSEIVQRGDNVWCKVISIDDEGKIGLSMKYVTQGSGKDLDPNGVDLAQDQRRRQPHAPYKPSKITLDAVFNTTCKKCGTSGHLAQDCFQVPGGKTYDILSDDQPEENAKNASSEEKSDERHVKKDKKKRKHKSSEKKKKRRHSSSSSESDEPRHKRDKMKKKS